MSIGTQNLFFISSKHWHWQTLSIFTFPPWPFLHLVFFCSLSFFPRSSLCVLLLLASLWGSAILRPYLELCCSSPLSCALVLFVSSGSVPFARLPLSQPRHPEAILRSAVLPAPWKQNKATGPCQASEGGAPARPPEERGKGR